MSRELTIDGTTFRKSDDEWWSVRYAVGTWHDVREEEADILEELLKTKDQLAAAESVLREYQLTITACENADEYFKGRGSEE